MEVFLIYSANQSFLSKAIKCYTKETYNHVSIALDKELNQTYSFGRKKITNPLIGGFVQEDFWDPFFLTSECAIYSLKITQEQYQSMIKEIDYFEVNKQLFQYNFLGLLALSLKLNFEREHAFFCSEFIATLLSKSKVTNFQKKHHFVTPKDILELRELEKIYEGQVINYLVANESSNFINALIT